MPSFKKSLIVKQFQGNYLKPNLHVEGDFLSEFKLSLTMNSRAMALFLAQKKEKERKLVCKRKRDARRRFQAYVRRRRVATQMFVLLITRNFFPLLPVRNRGLPLFGRRLVSAGTIKTGKKTFECHEWHLNT